MKLSYHMISLVAATALAANPISVEKIVVNSTLINEDEQFVKDTSSSNKQNEDVYTSKAISTLGTQANMNPYEIVSFSPSVNYTPVDQAGSNEPSYHDPIRIRSKSQTGPGGVYMIDGMPLSSNPGGGKQLLDMENVSSIDLHKGYLSVDKNLGFSSLIGKVDMNILNPKKELGADLSQSFGSNDFKRTFIRVDSGDIKDVRAFGSFSTIASNKTKGKGDLDRLNGMVGLSYNPSSKFKTELFAIKNIDDHYNYASLSYTEAKDLNRYFDKHYATLQPTINNDVNYYGWNRQNFATTAFLGNIEFRPTLNDTIIIKPYYKQDIGDYWFSKTNADVKKNRVMNWHMDHDLYGGIASYEHEFASALKAKLGYWYHRQQPPGPPSDQKKYKVVNGQLVYDGYAILAKNDYHTLQSPFIEFSGDTDNFHYSAGVKYQSFELGSLTSYSYGTSAATSADYDVAIATSQRDPWASVEAKTFNNFLPSVYLGYDLSDDTSIYTDYSRTYGFDVNLFPTYISNRAAFVSKGVTLQQLWDKLDLETSDNIDVGLKSTFRGITMNPNLYASFVKNKQANIYDAQFGVNYPANVGDALGYGAEFSAYGPLTESLELLLGLSYNKYYFTQNFSSSPTTTSDIKGNQLPDAPEYMAKMAISYYLGKWAFTPSVRYSSSRYGDVENTQKIDAYALVDLDISYKPESFLGSKNATFRLSATNLTNEKYISTINSPDNVLAASTTSSTYQTGAPFALYGSINLKY